MKDIDPYEIGHLTAEVQQLKQSQAEMEKDIKELLALANKSKGGFWMGMTIASIIGAVIAYLLKGWIDH
jgi:uncharacterized protein (DUF2062 family)